MEPNLRSPSCEISDESALQRLAREVTIMIGCGGPLHRVDWMRHIHEQLAAVDPLRHADLSLLAQRFDGSLRRAELFVRGVEVRARSFVEHSDASDWQPGSRPRALLEADLSLLAATLNPPPLLALSATERRGPGRGALSRHDPEITPIP